MRQFKESDKVVESSDDNLTLVIQVPTWATAARDSVNFFFKNIKTASHFIFLGSGNYRAQPVKHGHLARSHGSARQGGTQAMEDDCCGGFSLLHSLNKPAVVRHQTLVVSPLHIVFLTR